MQDIRGKYTQLLPNIAVLAQVARIMDYAVMRLKKSSQYLWTRDRDRYPTDIAIY
jgi:hypothetical protein